MKKMTLLNRLLIVAAISVLSGFIGCEKKGDTAKKPGTETESASAHTKTKTAPPAGYEFETPVRLKAGDGYVSVEKPGYACPTLADVDDDGKLDLVVGQFNNGHMQFCKNVADTGETPEFAKAEWIKSGDERAQVPGVW